MIGGQRNEGVSLVGGTAERRRKLAEEGIAKSLNRPFVRINMKDYQCGSDLVGIPRHYIDAKPGKIVEVLYESRCMNPVILYDDTVELSPWLSDRFVKIKI